MVRIMHSIDTEMPTIDIMRKAEVVSAWKHSRSTYEFWIYHQKSCNQNLKAVTLVGLSGSETENDVHMLLNKKSWKSN